MPRMRARRYAAALAICVCVIGIAVGVMFARQSGSSARGPAPDPVTLPAADVAAIESAIVSQDLPVVSAVLVGAVRESFLAAGVPLLPANSVLTVDSGTARGIPNSAATVNAEIVGAEPGRYVLELVFEDGRWLVAGTAPQT